MRSRTLWTWRSSCWPAAAILTLPLLACHRGIPSDEELLARYPDGGNFNSVDTLEMQVDCPVPPFLFGTSPQLARGVSIPFGEVHSDGGRSVHRWGLWHYFHVDPNTTIDSSGLRRSDLAARGEFRDGDRVGPWEFWFPGGELRAHGTFVDGKMAGSWTVWSAPGVPDPEHSGLYVDGVKAE